MIKSIWSHDCVIVNLGITIPVKMVFILEQAPGHHASALTSIALAYGDLWPRYKTCTGVPPAESIFASSSIQVVPKLS